MRLYLDEDMESHELVRALTKAGHDVTTPVGMQLRGESDAAQLTYAVREDRVCITANYNDYEELHDLILQCGGSHPGVLTLRGDGNRRRDMRPGQIVKAIKNMESVLSSVRDHVICLNDWR